MPPAPVSSSRRPHHCPRHRREPSAYLLAVGRKPSGTMPDSQACPNRHTPSLPRTAITASNLFNAKPQLGTGITCWRPKRMPHHGRCAVTRHHIRSAGAGFRGVLLRRLLQRADPSARADDSHGATKHGSSGSASDRGSSAAGLPESLEVAALLGGVINQVKMIVIQIHGLDPQRLSSFVYRSRTC